MSNPESRQSTTATQGDSPKVDRRRRALPQPDFAPYVKANAYPGAGYFFVGHSYNVDDEPAAEAQGKRVDVIKSIFQTKPECLAVPEALGNEALCSVLSRCERDLLAHLPAGALIGPAIDANGSPISESFTIWRKEMRRSATSEFTKPT